MAFMRLWRRLLGNQKTTSARLGMRGESLVAAYARRELKMKILARNVRCPGGEIDIVGLHDGDLVFVEVRTRSSDDNGPPEKTVDHRKQRFLLRSARWYMVRRRLMHLNARFDLAAVVWPPQAKPVIRYHRSYFSG